MTSALSFPLKLILTSSAAAKEQINSAHFEVSILFFLHKATIKTSVISGCFNDTNKHLTSIFKNRKMRANKFPNQGIVFTEAHPLIKLN